MLFLILITIKNQQLSLFLFNILREVLSSIIISQGKDVKDINIESKIVFLHR